MKRYRLCILAGGRSAEHDVSLQSARNVLEAINPKKYDILLIGIDQSGRWYRQDVAQFLRPGPKPVLQTNGEEMILVPAPVEMPIRPLNSKKPAERVDVVLPILHGTYGEDGTLQGALEMAGLAYVGAGVLGASVGMDKDVCKRLLRDAGIPVAKSRIVTRREWQLARLTYSALKRELGTVLFVKPCNLGSSVGISRARNPRELDAAMKRALQFDTKVLIEETIRGRELECAVLGNDAPVASAVGEIVPRKGFYSYEAKYLDDTGADLIVPAKLTSRQEARLREMAVCAYQALCCEGMGRVDFFLQERTGKLYVNEINTIPGFTRISMYPRLWQESGLSYTRLIDKLIALALERRRIRRRLRVVR
jgi:D-alanine-D-alanine ligase